MWLNHFDREEQVNKKRNNKIEMKQKNILLNPEKYGNDYFDENNIRKDKLITSSIKNGYGNSLVMAEDGCPIQAAHKMKQKKRDKLKKYLYQGKDKNGYEYNKYKLQNNEGVSIEMTPDYRFRRALDQKRAAYKDEIRDQMNRNIYKKKYDNEIEREEDMRNQK